MAETDDELPDDDSELRDFDCAAPPGFGEDLEEAVPPRPQPIAATCSGAFTAVHHDGDRPLSQIGLIVIHSTEGATASSAARWFTDRRSEGSAHLCVDDVECYRTLGNEKIPWGAPKANRRGFHIEIAGFAKWSTAEWMQHEKAMRRGAYKAALHAHRFGVPMRMLDRDDLRQGARGFVTHLTCTNAFLGGKGHTDPGHHFPVDRFMHWVAGYAKEIGGV